MSDEPLSSGLPLTRKKYTPTFKAECVSQVAARQIPHAKRGNKLYFTRPELEAWITAGKRGSGEK